MREIFACNDLWSKRCLDTFDQIINSVSTKLQVKKMKNSNALLFNKTYYRNLFYFYPKLKCLFRFHLLYWMKVANFLWLSDNLGSGSSCGKIVRVYLFFSFLLSTTPMCGWNSLYEFPASNRVSTIYYIGAKS